MWLVFLDEFGHEGFYQNRNDKRYNQSPVFGLGGIMLPSQKALECVSRYNNLKVKFHGETFKRYEVKGKVAFQGKSLTKGSTNYRIRKNVTDKGNGLLKILRECEAQIVYFGLEKYSKTPETHSAKKIHMSCTRRAFDRINNYCRTENQQFMLVFDRHELHEDKMLFIEMVDSTNRPNKIKIVNIPYDLDSNLHGCVQVADWICTLLGKIFAFQVRPKEWRLQQEYSLLFSEQIKELTSEVSSFQPLQHHLKI